MNKKRILITTQCVALAVAMAHGASSEDATGDSPLSFLTPRVREELSAELKAALIRRIDALELMTRLFPENGAGWMELESAWVKLGVGDLGGGKFGEARSAFEKAIAIEPGNFKASEGLAIGLVKLGKTGDALVVIDRALKIDPQCQRAWVFRGVFLLQERQLSEAGEALEKARATGPVSKDVLGCLGFLRLMEGKPAEALKEFDAALKIDPTDANFWNNRGIALRAMGDVPGGIESRQHALRIDPEDVKVRSEVMTWLSAEERWEETEKEAREVIARQPDDKVAWATLAQSHLKRKQWKEGVDEMLKAQSLGFEDRRADIELSQGLILLGRFDEAEKTLSKVLSSEPNSADALAYFGMLRRSQKRIEEGKQYSEKALAIEPGNTIALGNRISDCIDEILPDEAIQYAKRMLASLPPGDPRVWSAWLSMGWAEEKRGNAREALASYKKVAELAPNLFIGWEGVARASSDYAEACNAARKAAELAPNNEGAQVMLGTAQARLGKSKEAIATLEALLVKYPHNRFAAHELEELQKHQSLLGAAEPVPIPDVNVKKEPTWKLLSESAKDSSGGAMRTYENISKLSGWLFLLEDCRDIERTPEAAEARRKAAEAEPGNAGRWSELGQTLLAIATNQHSIRQSVEAEAQFRKTIELAPANADAPLWLALALFGQGRLSEAESICKKAAAQRPESAKAWLYLGQSRAVLGRDSASLEAYEHSISASPMEPAAWGDMIQNYSRMDLPKAEARIRQLLTDLPKAAPGWMALGRVLAMQQKFDEAAEAFRKSIALRELNPEAWTGLGTIHESQEKYAEAEKELRHAIEQSPRELLAWENLGNAYLRDNKIPKATDAARRALQLNSKSISGLSVLVQCLAKTGDMNAARAACDELEDVSPDLAQMIRGKFIK